MKHGVAPKTLVEVDSLQAYLYFSCKDYENLYLICQANLFVTS